MTCEYRHNQKGCTTFCTATKCYDWQVDRDVKRAFSKAHGFVYLPSLCFKRTRVLAVIVALTQTSVSALCPALIQIILIHWVANAG